VIQFHQAHASIFHSPCRLRVTKDTLPVNRYDGFTDTGAVVLRDQGGMRKAEIPDVTTRAETLGHAPLEVYKPTGAKHVDAAKASGNFTDQTYAAVNAIASEGSNKMRGAVIGTPRTAISSGP
jgi:hypothetical protein